MPTFATVTARAQRLVDRVRELPLAVDAVIATVCWTYQVIFTIIEDCFYWWVPPLALANALPLLWRRRYPFAITAIVGVSTVVMSLTEVIGHFPAAQLVATYTVAALCPLPRQLLAIACTIAGILASILIPKDEVLSLGAVGITFGTAYALGMAARARQDRIAMLEERARRLADEREAVATRERERIAREMHDILAHSMSMVAIQAEAGPLAVRSDPDKAEAMFDTIAVTSREALAQLRRALGVLRSDGRERRPPPGLDGLAALVDGVRRSGLEIALEEDGQARPVPQDLATTAYRIVQEALTNTVRHAAASSALVRVGWHDSALHLEVCDDGRGPGEEDGRGGHGLVGMRERVAAVRGELEYGPGEDGKGFRVAARLPLK